MTAVNEVLVVDASVAMKWHLTDEDYVVEAASLLRSYEQGAVDLIAPEQIRYEVPSAITVAARRTPPRLTVREGQEAIEDFLRLGLKTIGTNQMVVAAYPLVHRYGISFYDALYLTLAQILSVPFITADRKLYQRIERLPEAIWIGDYPTSGTPANQSRAT